ncbi:MAG: response regulator [Candidatus Latescibacterota bacterium]|nr:response regulator [Candidatus Latescibacterota bacterium]
MSATGVSAPRACKYPSDFAAEGSEAVAKYRSALEEGEEFDIVIMDLTIPGGMGGREALGHLLDIDEYTCAIVSSGYSDDPVMADYANHGFADVVAKPYDIVELSHILDRTTWFFLHRPTSPRNF